MEAPEPPRTPSPDAAWSRLVGVPPRLVASFGNWLGRGLARFRSRRRHVHGASLPTDPAHLAACLKPADVLLVEGETHSSTGIKYLTQSAWSHAALYVGAALGDVQPRCVVEADVIEGIRAVGLSAFAGLHVRVCRPVRLSDV